MAFNISNEMIRKTQEILDCSVEEARLACEKEEAMSIITRKYLCADFVSDTDMWEVLKWLIERS